MLLSCQLLGLFYTYENNTNTINFTCTIISKYINCLNFKQFLFRFDSDNIISILDTCFKKGDNSTRSGQFENDDAEISKNGLWFFILYVSCINVFINSKLFVAVTKESDKITTKSSVNEHQGEIKLEPDDFHGSMVDVSEEVEDKSDSSDISQNVNKISENVSGRYQ